MSRVCTSAANGYPAASVAYASWPAAGLLQGGHHLAAELVTLHPTSPGDLATAAAVNICNRYRIHKRHKRPAHPQIFLVQWVAIWVSAGAP